MVRNARAAMRDDDEPLHEEDVSVYDNGGHVVAGLTSFARKLHTIEPGDQIHVEVYRDGIVIETGGRDE
jgi:hypothetical protein